MRKYIFIFLIFFSATKCAAQAGQWVWLLGDSVTNNFGNFGIQGVPDSANNPPSLYEACEWTDHNGNFWLYGGTNLHATYSDLWKYDPATNEWTWMKGPGTGYYGSHYGVQGISSPTNNPPSSSYGVNSWVDLNGDLWLFGGGGGTAPGLCADLWKYTIATNEWTWMKGPGTQNYPGSYGSKGISSAGNNPPAREETSASWTDDAGNFWLFGGHSISVQIHEYNDMWKFDPTTNEWTWMKGSSIPNQPSVYGIRGIEDSVNTPGARWIYPRWKDNDGNLWCFGGSEDWSTNSAKNDLWRFNPQTANWTWIDGDSGAYNAGVNGTICLMSDVNIPTLAVECRAAWVDSHDNFWGYLYGYGIYNSLWKFCRKSREWAIINADSTGISRGKWGTKGVASPTNIPPFLQGSIAWTDGNDHLYMFGGICNNGLWSNALWMYTIDSTCGVCRTDVEVAEISDRKSGFVIFPNPNDGTFTICLADQTTLDNFEIDIYNMLGEKVHSEILCDNHQTIDYKLNSGIYFVSLITAEKQLTQKLIVE